MVSGPAVLDFSSVSLVRQIPLDTIRLFRTAARERGNLPVLVFERCLALLRHPTYAGMATMWESSAFTCPRCKTNSKKRLVSSPAGGSFAGRSRLDHRAGCRLPAGPARTAAKPSHRNSRLRRCPAAFSPAGDPNSARGSVAPWARTDRPLAINQPVRVIGRDGLVLLVTPTDDGEMPS